MAAVYRLLPWLTLSILQIIFFATNKNPLFFQRDPSYIYRCQNIGGALHEAGNSVHYSHLRQCSWRISPDVAVFHRPRWSMRLKLWVQWLKWRGCQIVADFDDLVFDPEYAAYSPGVLNKSLSLKKTLKNYRAHQRALALFDCITVSTAPLREHILRHYPDKTVGVLPNAVHQQWRTQFDSRPLPLTKWQHPVISYLPGTRSHDRDFELFREGLIRFLHTYPQVQLQVTGPLNFALPVNPKQIIHREKVPFAEYHQHIQSAWVNLAPLEDTPFTRCKSALKVIEAGYWGKPTICSPNPDAERFIGNGGCVVSSADELYLELEKLLDSEYYQNYVNNLRERVLQRANIYQVAENFLDVFGLDAHC